MLIAPSLGLKEYKCTFDGCDVEYGDGASLIRHEKRVHKYYRKLDKTQNKTHKTRNLNVVKRSRESYSSSSGSESEPEWDLDFLAASAASTPTSSAYTSGPPTPSPSFTGDFVNNSAFEHVFAPNQPLGFNEQQLVGNDFMLGTQIMPFPIVNESLPKHHWDADAEFFLNLPAPVPAHVQNLLPSISTPSFQPGLLQTPPFFSQDGWRTTLPIPSPSPLDTRHYILPQTPLGQLCNSDSLAHTSAYSQPSLGFGLDPNTFW